MAIETRKRIRTPLCSLLGCEVPILLAGMGGVARWELAAAVANAGGFPALGMVSESPELIASEVKAMQAATDRPFAVNLIPTATDTALLDAQINQCFELGITAFSFFWDVLPDVVARIKNEGALVLHQVGTAQQAQRAEDAGADVTIAQGTEAGDLEAMPNNAGLIRNVVSAGTRIEQMVTEAVACFDGGSASSKMC